MRFYLLFPIVLGACSFIDDFDDFHIGLRSVDSDASSSADGGVLGDGSAPDDNGSCALAADGTPCGSGAGLICVAQVCRVSGCGDGHVDAERGEQCDDQNQVPGDGCEPTSCQFSCASDNDCRDDDVCDGSETCADHRCQPGLRSDDLSCARVDGKDGTCQGGYCVPEGCGNGQKDPGEECDGAPPCRPDCLNGCSADADCPDANLCEDLPHCDTASGMCTKLPAADCDDGDACTSDSCKPASGCVHAVLDADHDGFAPGACAAGSPAEGGDCDDAKPAVYPGASEYCDGLDNDCDSKTDEQAGEATCYPDADGDGFPLKQGGVLACFCPVHTLPERSDHLWDCWDVLDDAGRDVFPGQTDAFATGYDARCRDDVSPCEVIRSYDFDCDGNETPELTQGNVSSCGLLGGALACSPSGYTGAPPACGASGPYLTCTPNGGVLGGCSAGTMARAQPCR